MSEHTDRLDRMTIEQLLDLERRTQSLLTREISNAQTLAVVGNREAALEALNPVRGVAAELSVIRGTLAVEYASEGEIQASMAWAASAAMTMDAAMKVKA